FPIRLWQVFPVRLCCNRKVNQKVKNSMAKIRVTSPTRIDLAGGTLDLWPLYAFLNGAVTVNLAVNIFTRVEIEELSGSQIVIDLKNIGYQKKFSNVDQLLKVKNEKTQFIHPHIRFWK